MKRLKQVFAQRYNRQTGRIGHIWGDRYWSLIVDDAEAGGAEPGEEQRGEMSAGVRPKHGERAAGVRPQYEERAAGVRPQYGERAAGVRPRYEERAAGVRPQYGERALQRIFSLIFAPPVVPTPG
jgi:hypothetical protein